MMGQSGGAGSRKVRRIIKELEAELEEKDDWFSSLDRRVYLVFVQMAYRVSEQYYYDLTGRYRFHMAIQGIYKTARYQQGKAHFYADWAFGRQELSRDDFLEVTHVLRDARKALKTIVRDADEINMPAMKNFVEGGRLGDFLLDGDLIREPPEYAIKGKWVVKLLKQLDEVKTKAQRLHFKSLGGILALQEKLAEQWSGPGRCPSPAAGVEVEPASIAADGAGGTAF